jgi:hypothetical protein
VNVDNCNVTEYALEASAVENTKCVWTPEPGVKDTVQVPVYETALPVTAVGGISITLVVGVDVTTTFCETGILVTATFCVVGMLVTTTFWDAGKLLITPVTGTGWVLGLTTTTDIVGTHELSLRVKENQRFTKYASSSR